MSKITDVTPHTKVVSSHDDDWVDRLNHLYTVVLLTIFAMFITGWQSLGTPMECWCPAYFTDTFVAYTKSYCWVKNTYYIPMDKPLPLEKEHRDSEELTYYQWVPIILLFMAFMFKFPALTWRMFNSGSGINMDKIVTMTSGTQMGSSETRIQMVSHIASYLDRYLEIRTVYSKNAIIRMRQKASRFIGFLCFKWDGNYLTRLYFVMKILYVVNVIVQFFLLNAFMGDWYNLYGLEVLDGIANDRYWRDSPRFPKITLCDFEIRQLQNIQTFTVQCVLPINLFNEKIFIFLWFWFVFVASCTCGNFLFWIWRALFHCNRVAYIKKYLKTLNQISNEQDKKLVRKFADQYLRNDGVFILRIIARNTNDILLCDLVEQLWFLFKEKPTIKKAIQASSTSSTTPGQQSQKEYAEIKDLNSSYEEPDLHSIIS